MNRSSEWLHLFYSPPMAFVDLYAHLLSHMAQDASKNLPVRDGYDGYYFLIIIIFIFYILLSNTIMVAVIRNKELFERLEISDRNSYFVPEAIVMAIE